MPSFLVVRVPCVTRSRAIPSARIATEAIDALAELPADETLRDLVAEAARTDEPADDHHREHHDGRLVDAEHHGVSGERKLDLPQHLQPRRAEGARRLDGRQRDVTHAPLDEPYRDGERIEDACHDPGDDRDPHQVDERNDVDELAAASAARG